MPPKSQVSYDEKKEYKKYLLNKYSEQIILKRIFVNTDVCLDLLSFRKSFNRFAEKLFSPADTKKIEICISALSFSNPDYVLHSQYDSENTRNVIACFKTLATTLVVTPETDLKFSPANHLLEMV